MSLLWLYFIFAERLTEWYGNETSEMATFWSIQRGKLGDHWKSSPTGREDGPR
jgi:hypothetical protein